MKYTKIVLVNKNQYLSKTERAEILHYANTFIWGVPVENKEQTFLMSVTHVEGNVYKANKALWQYTPFGGVRCLSKAHSVLIKLT